MTLGYITIGAHDVEGALPFYDAVLGAVGYVRGPLDGGWAFYGKGDAPGVGICRPHDGQPARGGNGIMIAFKADSHDQVKAAYARPWPMGGRTKGRRAFGRRRLTAASTALMCGTRLATSSASTTPPPPNRAESA